MRIEGAHDDADAKSLAGLDEDHNRRLCASRLRAAGAEARHLGEILEDGVEGLLGPAIGRAVDDSNLVDSVLTAAGEEFRYDSPNLPLPAHWKRQNGIAIGEYCAHVPVLADDDGIPSTTTGVPNVCSAGVSEAA